MKKNFKFKSASLKDARTLTGSALLTALAVIIDFFRVVVSSTFEISFGFLALAFAGLLYGPIVGGMVGGISDIIQYILRPTGPFFPGFTLNSILAGVIYGYFLYNKEISIKRVAFAVLVEGMIITLILTPIWLNLMYGAAIFALPRIIRFVIMLPIKITFIYGFAKVMERQRLLDKFRIAYSSEKK